MTEQQKTELAIKSAKNAKKKTKQYKESTTTTKEVVNDLRDIVQAEQKQQVNKTKYPFSVILGQDKEVNFKYWTGKTKKKFKNLFKFIENPDEINVDEIMQVLIRDNIHEKDIYLDSAEQQYLTAMLRKESIEDKFKFEQQCEHCDSTNTINTSISDCVKYQGSSFPFDDGKFLYKDIKSFSDFQKIKETITKSEDYDGLTSDADIEIAMHLEKDAKTPSEIIDYLEELSIKDLDDVLVTLQKRQAKLEMHVEKACHECGKENKFVTEEIPGLFDSLLN